MKITKTCIFLQINLTLYIFFLVSEFDLFVDIKSNWNVVLDDKGEICEGILFIVSLVLLMC